MEGLLFGDAVDKEAARAKRFGYCHQFTDKALSAFVTVLTPSAAEMSLPFVKGNFLRRRCWFSDDPAILAAHFVCVLLSFINNFHLESHKISIGLGSLFCELMP